MSTRYTLGSLIVVLVLALTSSLRGVTILTVVNTNNTGEGSLRAAITTANGIDPSEPIIIDLGILRQLSGSVIELTGPITLLRPVDIINSDVANPITLRFTGTPGHLIFALTAPGSSTLAGLRFENGSQPASTSTNGGAIFYGANTGATTSTLMIQDCAFVGNVAGESGTTNNNNGRGGAIFFTSVPPNVASLIVRRTLFENNHARASQPDPLNRAAEGGPSMRAASAW